MPESPQTPASHFWKRKLAAFLHDPPSKALDIRTHTERSEKAMQAAELGTPEERRAWANTADHTAAAADRFPFPHHSKASLSCAFDGVRNAFHHPLHGQQTLPFDGPFITVEQAIEGEQTTQPVLNDLTALPTEEQDRARFLAHWRLWAPRSAEKDWRFAYLPADTRIPDHTIWNHMQIVSALESCRGSNAGLQPAFLKFQLGPVQDFIAAARSTRDLWSGSFLLSWLMAQGLAKLSLDLGPDSMVFPSLREQPLVDLALKDAVWEKVKIGDSPVWDSFKWSQDELLTPNLPNVFLAIVPADRAETLAKSVCDTIKNEWKRIAESVWNECKNEGLWNLSDGLQPPHERRLRFDHQIETFLSLSWSVLPWPETLPEIEKLAEMLPSSSTMQHYQSTKAAAESIRALGQQDDRYFDAHGQLKNAGLAWSLLTALSSWQLDAVRQTREFHANLTDPIPSRQHTKDSLTGKEEAIAGGPEWKGKGQANRFKHDDYLSAPTLVKRLWDRSYLHQESSKDSDMREWQKVFGNKAQPMPNTRSLAAKNPNADDADDDIAAALGETYFAVIAFDGDDMGKWISGEKTPPFSNQLANYEGGGSLAYFQRPEHAEKFAKFLQTPRPLSPSYHLQFSECLSNFALRCVRPIVEAHDGRLIYAGGDDVVALLPADTALACANDLQLAFKGQQPLNEEAGIQQKAPGFLTSKAYKGDGDIPIPFMVPGPAASASVGIAIAHFKSPLQDTIRAAQAAEKRAKKAFAPKKGAVAVTVMKRSGEIVEWAARWEDAGVQAATLLLDALNNQTVSAKFPYRLGEFVSVYRTQSTSLMKPMTAVRDFDLAAVFAHELHTVLTRQRGPAWAKKGEEFEQTFSSKMKEWITSMLVSLSLDEAISEILALCAYCGFAKRQGTESNAEKQA
jgi:CRISPR-associated protein Cmr2